VDSDPQGADEQPDVPDHHRRAREGDESARQVILRALARSAAALLLAFVPALASAQDAARAAKMIELVENVNLPFVQRLFMALIEETRREMPAKFVEGIGTGAKLGPKWKAGNPHFDRARARIDAKIVESERQGRLEPPGRREIAQAIRTSWTDE